MGDVIESQAIDAVYGKGPLVTGLKSYMGHTMGTCGVIELTLMLYMMEQGFVAPTLNLDTVDPRCSMLRHARELSEQNISVAAIQNFAFGGVNTCLVLKNGREAVA
jgi:3-oxoacyl-[acyl-carrier-protein] synthase II